MMLKYDIFPIKKEFIPSVQRYVYEYVVSFGDSISIPFIDSGNFSVVPDAIGVVAYYGLIVAARPGATYRIEGGNVYFLVPLLIFDLTEYNVLRSGEVLGLSAKPTGHTVGPPNPTVADYEFFIDVPSSFVPAHCLSRLTTGIIQDGAQVYNIGRWNGNSPTGMFWFVNWEFGTVVDLLVSFGPTSNAVAPVRFISGISEFRNLDNRFWLPSGRHLLRPSGSINPLSSTTDYYVAVVLDRGKYC